MKKRSGAPDRSVSAVLFLVLAAWGCGARYDPTKRAVASPLRYCGANERGYDEYLRERDAMRMVRIPAGAYLRRPYNGSLTPDGQPVGVPGYLIDKYEVTAGQFAAFLNATGTGADRKIGKTVRPIFRTCAWGIRRGRDCWAPQAGYEKHPMVGVTAWGAALYARWAGGEAGGLPTADQWMKAAGGPDGQVFPFHKGANAGPPCNSYRSGLYATAPVGYFPDCVSPVGCFDMAGNVYERVRSDRTEGKPVMIKGGSWATDHPLNLRVLDLCMQPMGAADLTVGFRCVIDEKSLPEPLSQDPRDRVREPPADPCRFPPGPREGAFKPPAGLILARTVAEGIAQARERNCPILLGLFYDTCGQCDRTRTQVFSDPAFIEHVNERCIVVVGQDPWDGADDPHPQAANGVCTLWPSLSCDDHERVFREGVSRVGRFSISPGCFLLTPHAKEGDPPGSSILVPEADLPKSGMGLSVYLDKLREAQGTLGPGLSRSEWKRIRQARSEVEKKSAGGRCAERNSFDTKGSFGAAPLRGAFLLNLSALEKGEAGAADALAAAVAGKCEKIPLVADALGTVCRR